MVATKRIKYLRTNLIKNVKGLYSENYKTLKKEIEEDTNKWKHIPCSWIGRINIIKMSILPKTIYRFNTIPIKIPMTYFTKLEQIFQKFMWNQKAPLHSNSNLRKKNKFGGIMLPNIKLYYKAIVIKTAWCWHKNKPMDQWNKIESPETNLQFCSHIPQRNGLKIVYSINCVRKKNLQVWA